LTGRFGVTIEVTSPDGKQDALVRVDDIGLQPKEASIGRATCAEIGETNQFMVAINGYSIGIAVAALDIPIGEKIQATLTTATDQIAQCNVMKSTLKIEDGVWPRSESPSQVTADVGSTPLLKAPVITPGDPMGRTSLLDQCNCEQPILGCAYPTKTHCGMASQFKIPKNFKHILCLDKRSEHPTSNEWGMSIL
jgi:hypothetical protein